jgi:hypothetical protein
MMSQILSISFPEINLKIKRSMRPSVFTQIAAANFNCSVEVNFRAVRRIRAALFTNHNEKTESDKPDIGETHEPVNPQTIN